MEQSLQVCALPLSGHVEVGQLHLEGPLRGGKGCQLRELWPLCLAGPADCRSQMGRLLGQLQASTVLGLSEEGGVSTQLPPWLRSPSESGTSHWPTAELRDFLSLSFVIYTRGSRPLPRWDSASGKLP